MGLQRPQQCVCCWILPTVDENKAHIDKVCVSMYRIKKLINTAYSLNFINFIYKEFQRLFCNSCKVILPKKKVMEVISLLFEYAPVD